MQPDEQPINPEPADPARTQTMLISHANPSTRTTLQQWIAANFSIAEDIMREHGYDIATYDDDPADESREPGMLLSLRTKRGVWVSVRVRGDGWTCTNAAHHATLMKAYRDIRSLRAAEQAQVQRGGGKGGGNHG